MISPIDQFVIHKVKEFRLLKKMTQADLAFGINVSPGFIGKAESGKYSTKYNLALINKIAKVLEISPRDLLPEGSL